MSFFEELDRRAYDALNSLVVLVRDSTFTEDGANAVELQNYGAWKGISYLVNKGYVDVEMRKVEGLQDEEHYRISDKGKDILERILMAFD
jgi:hypothetical protein|tara:strand:+ start:45 stop:314 length:270 start_codon:yes stop_codon:yes gene_type:complete